MFLNALASVSTALRPRALRQIIASTPRLSARIPSPSIRINHSALAVQTRYSSHVALENLAPPAGTSKNKRRVGRGVGSKRGGHTSGRGHKGAKARGTGNPYEGFEGGQTPLYRRVPKRGFVNVFKKEYCPLNIATVQRWIADARFNPSEPLTIQKAVHTNMVHGLSKWNGIKLVGTPTRSMPLPPLTVHLSRFSEKAGKAIIAAGGSCLSVYHNRLSLRQEVFPEKFVGREIKSAGPTRRPDIEFYTNPDKFGYLADKKDEFFRERGWEPDSKKRRAMRGRAKARGSATVPETVVPEAEAAAQ